MTIRILGTPMRPLWAKQSILYTALTPIYTLAPLEIVASVRLPARWRRYRKGGAE